MDIDADDQQRMLGKVRGLLNKAESTPYGPEQDALVDKATALMARWRITAAMVDATRSGSGPSSVGPIVDRDLDMGTGAYVRCRLQLLDVVARHLSCRVLTSIGGSGRIAHVHGHRDDVTATEVLYTSLLMQATAAAVAHTPAHASSAVRFRYSFLFGFIERISERLAETMADAIAESESSAAGAALVLADRASAVDRYTDARYGRIRKLGRAQGRITAQGAEAGRTAADHADLADRAPVTGRPRALGGH